MFLWSVTMGQVMSEHVRLGSSGPSTTAGPPAELAAPLRELRGNRIDPIAAAAVRTGAPVNRSVTRARNIRMMHTLERIVRVFNREEVPLMVLKGAALNLTLYDDGGDRPMDDVDLLVHPRNLSQAVHLLEYQLDCTPGAPMVRSDFFPRYHYETEYVTGAIRPIKIDLHVRPFRPLRYGRTVPAGALWDDARVARLGRAVVHVPSAEGMLIHLAGHAAIHGCCRPVWDLDIQRWVQRHPDLDWDQVVEVSRRWGIVHAVRRGLAHAETACGSFCPAETSALLAGVRVSWRERLALWQAPRDVTHPVCHVCVNVLCTPGWRVRLGYLAAVCFPGREHMAQCYAGRHRGWLGCAHVCRVCRPLIRGARALAGLMRLDRRPAAIP